MRGGHTLMNETIEHESQEGELVEADHGLEQSPHSFLWPTGGSARQKQRIIRAFCAQSCSSLGKTCVCSVLHSALMSLNVKLRKAQTTGRKRCMEFGKVMLFDTVQFMCIAGVMNAFITVLSIKLVSCPHVTHNKRHHYPPCRKQKRRPCHR